MKKFKRKYVYPYVICLVILLLCGIAAEAAPQIPKINIGIDEATNPRDVSLTLELLFLFTILSLAPGIIMMTTAFTRVVIVMLFLQRALSLQEMPPKQVIVSIALFISFYIMAPTFSEINTNAIQPYMSGQMPFAEAFDKGLIPMRNFMFKHVREKDLEVFLNMSKSPRPKNFDEVPTHILLPSFVLSELRTAFIIGLLLFIPFIVIDMIVASTLMSMGMIMLPPIMVSIPFKILVFVMVDGWNLLTQQIVLSFS
jgi:flagellar biosynthetic protein FliP